MKKGCLLIIWYVILMVFFGCSSSSNQNGIDQIYTYSLNIGFTETEYKIDLRNNKLYQFVTSPDNIQIRDPKATNEGYQKVDDLAQDKITAFLKDAKKYGFSDWNESYIRKDFYDGYQWGITITFTDGTTKEITGRNAFPKNWNNMVVAFKELTGIDFIYSVSSE